MKKLFQVRIKPFGQSNTHAVKAVIMRILGPDSNNDAIALIENGGTVFDGLNEEAANHLASQLREAGAEVEVLPLGEGEKMKQQLFRVRLISYGEKRIHVIKVVREVTRLGLKESKELVENLGVVEDGVAKNEALKTKAKLEDAGATVTLEPIGESKEDEFIVHGKVTLPNGEPAGHFLVRAYDRDLRSKELLGEATTLKDGKYRVRYSSENFSKAEKQSADLVVRVHNELGLPLQAEFSREGTIFNAENEEEVNVQILKGEPIIPSEYEKLTSFLTPLLDGATLVSLTDEEIEFLVHESEIEEFEDEFPAGASSIAYLSESAKRSEETGLQTEVFYGWARLIKGLISKDGDKALRLNLEKLLENNNEKLIKTLQSSVEDNIIPKKMEDQLERIADLLNRLRNEKSLKEREDWKTYEIQGRLLNTENEEPLSGFNVTAKDLKANSTFQNLGTITTGPDGNFSFELQVPGNESDASREIEWIVTAPSNEEVHRETVAIVPGADELFTLTVTVPKPKLPGEDIKVNDLPLELSGELKGILESNGITNMAHLLKKGGVAQLSEMPDGLRDSEEVRQLQGFAHLSLLSPDLEPEIKIKQSQSLMTHGYYNPHDIANESLSDFQNNLSEELSAEHLVQLYNVGKAQSFLLDNYAVDRLTNFRTYGETEDNNEEVSQQDPRLICSCEDCQSAISPGAYLTDLVGYVTKHVRNTDTNKRIDLDFLVDTFHHPLKELPINCAAIKTEVRQVRIAIEVLYKSLGSQLNTLQDTEGLKNYVQSSYEILLRETGTSLRDLQRASSDKDKEDIAERIGIAAKHVEDLYLSETAQDPSNLLSENNLERIFGLPAFLNVGNGSVTLYDPLRFLKDEGDEPLLYKWRLEHLQEQWRDLDFPEDNYSKGTLPIIDPDLIGPDDFRNPSTTDKNFSLWVKRRKWLDEKLNNFWSLIDTQDSGTSFDKLLNAIQEDFSYTTDGGQVETSKPWSEATDQVLLLEKHKEFSTFENKETVETWLKKRHLTYEAFTALAKIAYELPTEDGEENETWNVAIDILAKSLKKAFYTTWVKEENDEQIELDPRNFWDSLTEPKEGKWSVLIENERPLIDPENVEQRELPDGAVGENARELWQERKNKLSDKKEDFLSLLQTDEDDRLIRTLQLALNDPPAVPNADNTWTSAINELNKQQQSLDVDEQKEAKRIINEVLYLDDKAFSRLVRFKDQLTDPDFNPDKDAIEKIATDLTTAHKEKTFYTDWSQEENDQRLVYWKAYKARLPKWRGSLEARFVWKYALDTRGRAPIIDPDIVPGEAIAEPVPGEKAFDLWRKRTLELDQKLQNLKISDISTRDGVSILFNEVLGITIDKLLTLGHTEKQGQRIDARLDQLTLTREAYWLLLEVAQRIEDGKTVLDETWKSVRAILLQVWKKRQFALWRKEEKVSISLSPELFMLPANGRIQIPHAAPEMSWRIDTRRKREWQRTLRSRQDQQNFLSGSLKEVIVSVEEQNLPELRDHLIEFLDTTPDTLSEKADRLTDRFFIDMRNSGCQTTTRVGMALEVLQILVFSIQSGKLDLGDIELKLSAPNFDAEWRWMGSYATWKAAMGVFLYPEQVLLPSLKRDKSPAFNSLIDELSNAGQLNSSDTCKSASRYFENLDDIRNLVVDATCYATTTKRVSTDCGSRAVGRSKLLHLFGIGRNLNQIYVSVFNNQTKEQSHWEPIPNIKNVKTIVGATPYEENLLLFVLVAENEEYKLYLMRYNLETGIWKDPQILEVPDKTHLLSTILVDQIDDSKPPLLALNLQPSENSNKFPYLTLKRLNKAGLKWEQDVGSWEVDLALGVGGLSTLIVSAIEIEDGYFIFWGSENTGQSMVEYIEKKEKAPWIWGWGYSRENFEEIRFKYKFVEKSSKYLDTDIIGAFRYPQTNEIYGLSKSGIFKRFFPEEDARLVNRHLDNVDAGITYESPNHLGIIYKTTNLIAEEHAGGLLLGYGNLTRFSTHTGGYPDGILIRTVAKNRSSIHPYESKESNGSFICTIKSDQDVDELRFLNDSSSTRITPFIDDNFKNHKGKIALNPVFDVSTDISSYYRFMLRVSSEFFLNENNDNGLSYIEEAYYFVPLAIAISLSQAGNYDDALNWFKRVYDYEGLSEHSDEFDRFGITFDSKVIYSGLIGDNLDNSFVRDQSWLADPINPHYIASRRTEAYKKYTVLSILRCLLDYGEAEFTLDTVESIAIARVLFNTASDLLDTPPLKSTSPSCQQVINSLTYQVDDITLKPLWKNILASLKKIETINDLQGKITEIKDILEGDSDEERKLLDVLRIAKKVEDSIASFKIIPNIHVLLERNRRHSMNFNIPALASFEMANYNWPTTTDTTVSEGPTEIEPVYQGIDFEFSPSVQYAFCVPENPTAKFLKLRADLNLFKIRNCMNIAGMRRELEPYAAPTDVESALPSMGAGGQINLPGTNQIRPTQYRYNVLVERARQMAGLAQQTESAFLSALQSKDQEAYTLFIAKQNVQTSKAGVKLQNLRLREAENGVGLAELQLERSSILEETYAQWLSEGVLEQEQALLSAYRQLESAQMNAANWRYMSQVAQAAVSAASADISAGSAFAAFTVAVATAFSENVATGKVIKAKSDINEVALNLSIELRNRGYDLQHKIAVQDKAIGQQQITLAEDRVGIVEQEKEIAELQTEQAEDVVLFLQNKFTSAELYDWMSGVLERIFRYYLQQGASMAKLAETQLAFERQEALLGVIENDYYDLVSKDDSSFGSNDDSDTNRRGITGSARLLRDITKLDQYAFTTDQRKQQLSVTFSLAQLDPFAFQKFRKTGVLTFDTPKEYFDRRFPGQYLRLIKRVRTSVIALVPPTEGIGATLSSSGISRVVTGGDIYQTRVIRRDPETIAFTSPAGATGVFELNPNPGMLLPFEGNGVDTRWEFQMPKASNALDFRTIADVLITIEYTALHDFTYQKKIQSELDPYINADRAFSFRQQFADAWYDLNNPDQTSIPMSVKFDTRRDDFPPNVKDLSISQILLYFVSEEDLPEALTAEFIFYQDGVGLGGEAAPIEGVISTRRGNGSSWLPIIGKVPEGEWQLSLANSPRIINLFKEEKIQDILFVITYSGQSPGWPG
jgi:ribosomal protein L7/L12